MEEQRGVIKLREEEKEGEVKRRKHYICYRGQEVKTETERWLIAPLQHEKILLYPRTGASLGATKVYSVVSVKYVCVVCVNLED